MKTPVILSCFLLLLCCNKSFSEENKGRQKIITPYKKEITEIDRLIESQSFNSIDDQNLNITSAELNENTDYLDLKTIDFNTSSNVYSIKTTINKKDYIKEGAYSISLIKQTKYTIGHTTFNNVKCFKVIDKYSIKNVSGNSQNFQYSNIYFYLFDGMTNEYIANVNFISVKVGFLESEYKFIEVNPSNNTAQKINTSPRRQISSLLRSDNLTISPNPAQSSVTFNYTLESDKAISLGIYDISGRLVESIIENQPYVAGAYSKQLTNIRLTPGVYFVKLQSNNSLITSKLIIQ